MTVYALAQLSIHDRARYDRYAARFLPVLAKYGGRLLAADEQPEVIEGSWPFQKVVLIAFADREQLWRWANSQEYAEISVDRKAASEVVSLVVEGIELARHARAPKLE